MFVLCVAAAATMEMHREAIASGMQPTVLTKPIDNEKLFNEVAHLPPFKQLLSL